MNLPEALANIQAKAASIGFDQGSEIEVSNFLRTLVASKPSGVFLELGTGAGFATAHMLSAMDDSSYLVSVDLNEAHQNIAKEVLTEDERVEFRLEDGAAVIAHMPTGSFDLVFADTWPGKFTHLEETLALLKLGGFYVIDDLAPVKSWPEGHGAKVEALTEKLNARGDFVVSYLSFATGVIVATRMS